MKKLLIALALLISTLAQAGELYGIATGGGERLRYDVDGWLNRQLDKGSRRDYLRLFELAGGQVKTETNLNNLTLSAGIGYRQDNRLSYELIGRTYRPRSISARLQAGGEVFDISSTLGGHSGSIVARASGSATAVATLTARSLSASALYQLHGPVFIRGGAEFVRATVETLQIDGYSYEYTITVDGIAATTTRAVQHVKRELNDYEVVLPLLGIGVAYPLSQKWTIRAELQHVGLIKEGFDSLSLSTVFTF